MARTKKKRRPIHEKIVSIDQASEYLNILVYGRNGQGKTRFAASAPKCLILDINERGTMSAREFTGAEVLPVTNWHDIVEAYWYLKEGSHDYESVAVDTLTAMQALCMRHVLKEEVQRDPNKDPAMASKREWGKVAELMKPMLLAFRNLPMHLVYTAQERTVGDPDEGEQIERVPEMSPGSRGPAMGAVDVIGRIYQREVKQKKKEGKKRPAPKWETRLLVGPHDEFATKDRTGALGRIVRNPTVPAIIDAAFKEG